MTTRDDRLVGRSRQLEVERNGSAVTLVVKCVDDYEAMQPAEMAAGYVKLEIMARRK